MSRRGFVNGFHFNCLTTASAGEPAAGYVSNAQAPWGRDHHQWFERHFAHGVGVHAIGDDLPNPDNRVTTRPLRASTPMASRRRSSSTTGRKRPANDELHARPHGGHRQGGGRLRLQGDHYRDANGVYRTPAWHMIGTCRMGAARTLGGQQVEPELGRAQSLHRRRQRAGDGGRGQSDADHIGAGPSRGDLHPRQFSRPLGDDPPDGGLTPRHGSAASRRARRAGRRDRHARPHHRPRRLRA